MASHAKLSREDWIAGALKLLAERGAAAVRVEPLAARLNVTKGSFYWHFRDLADLQDAIREEWANRSTDWVIARVDGHDGNAAARLRKLLEMAGVKPPEAEKAIRAWAAADPRTEETVRAVDEKRTNFVCGLLVEMGYEKIAAEAVARMLTCFVVGELMCGLAPRSAYNAAIAQLICGETG